MLHNSKKIIGVILIIAALSLQANLTRADNASSTPSSSPSPEASPTPTSTPEATPSASPTPSVTPSPSPSDSPSPSPSSTVSPSPTPSVTPSPSPSNSPSPSPSVSPTPASTPEEPKDITPPSPITDLHAQFVSGASVDLAWTVPHDDTGVASYDIRVSDNPITDDNWGSAFPLSSGGGANREGGLEVKTLSNMPPDKKIFIAVKAQDDAGNESALSNVIEVHTKKRAHTGPASAQPSSGEDANAPTAAQQPLTPRNQGTVRMVIKTPNGGVPDDLIFVNFISIDSGISFGGSAVDGLIATNLPNGKYKVRMLLAPQYAEPKSLPQFEIIDDASVDLGVIVLEQGSGGNNFSAVVEGKGGIAKALAFIIQLLFRILEQLQQIAAKMKP